MKPSEIKPGAYYRAHDIYEDEMIRVLVIEPSANIEGHWVCRRPDGRKVLLPSTAILGPSPK